MVVKCLLQAFTSLYGVLNYHVQSIKKQWTVSSNVKVAGQDKHGNRTWKLSHKKSLSKAGSLTIL